MHKPNMYLWVDKTWGWFHEPWTLQRDMPIDGFKCERTVSHVNFECHHGSTMLRQLCRHDCPTEEPNK